MWQGWKLFLSNALFALLIVLVFGRCDDWVEGLVLSLVAAGLWAVGQAWMFRRTFDELAEWLRRLSAADIAAPAWSSAVPCRPHSELGMALEDLLARTRQHIDQLDGEKFQLEVILDSMNEAVLVTGRAGRVLLANAALA